MGTFASYASFWRFFVTWEGIFLTKFVVSARSMESQVANFTVDLLDRNFLLLALWYCRVKNISEHKIVFFTSILTSSSGPSIALKYPTCVLHLMQEKHFLWYKPLFVFIFSASNTYFENNLMYHMHLSIEILRNHFH